MQLIRLIICNRRISSKMLLGIPCACFLTFILKSLHILRWHFWSLMLMLCNLFNRVLFQEIIQIELLLPSGILCVRSSVPVILETVLGKFREVLFSTIWHFRFLVVFDRVETLSVSIFSIVRLSIHVIDSLKFHCVVLSSFISCFRTTLSFVITPSNRS